MVTTHFSGISMTVDQSATRVARDARWSSVMAAAQDGDCAGYNTLLRDVLPPIRAVCRARLRGAADVDDAVQDTLLSLHALRRTYDPARPFKPWLNSIAERRAIERLRKLDRTTGRESIIDDLPEGVGATQAVGTARHGPDGGGGTASGGGSSAGQPAPGATTGQIAETPLKEAAALSGMTVGALKVATHRAVAALRGRLGPAMNNDDLIERLSAHTAPVRCLGPPWQGALLWLDTAAALLAAAVAIYGFRHDIEQRLSLMHEQASLGFALLTGMQAAFAAFHLARPDGDQRWLWLPMVPAFGWVAGKGLGCLADV